jgi:acyl-CoA reductase-like NAD-dependent aldehyde dehydrogenase
MSNVCAQDPQTTANSQVQQLMDKARAAQATFESFSQETVDAIVKGIAKYVYDNAEMLARMAVDETGIGVYEDKILKNKGKARAIWNNLKDKKSEASSAKTTAWASSTWPSPWAWSARSRQSPTRSSRRCATACSR